MSAFSAPDGVVSENAILQENAIEKKGSRQLMAGLRKLIFAILVTQVIGITIVVSTARAQSGDGGTISNPDLKTEGFAYFGTNVTGATVVTSGWGNVFIEDSLEIGGSLIVNGSAVNPDQASGKIITTTPATQIITAAGGINPTNTYIRIAGSGGNVNITRNPQILTGLNGQQLLLLGTSDSQRVTIDDGNGVQTSMDQSFHMGIYDTMMLVFDGATTNWVEIYRSDN